MRTLRGSGVLRAIAVVLSISTIMVTAAHAQGSSLAVAPQVSAAPAPATTRAAGAVPNPSAFATSLQIAPPGPQLEAHGLTFHFTLTWSARPGATAYRVFMWTDAARTWYKVTQTTGTSADAHAFRSGCTAFLVLAFANANAPAHSLTGLDATNVVRFPLSQRPDLCPARHP